MLEHLIAIIQREIDSVEHSILNGGCPDYTVYREQVGTLNGYRHAIELARQAYREDDDADLA